MSYFLGAPRKVPKIPMSPRQIVLNRDLVEMEQLKTESSIMEFQVSGKPPDHYKIVFHGKSLVPDQNRQPMVGNRQELEIVMGNEYPRSMPQVTWRTVIMHPNISRSGNVCFGNFSSQWTPSFHLTELVEILWDYSRLKTLNASHGNYGGWGVNWAELEKRFFPRGEGVDERALRSKLVGKNKGSSLAAPPAAAGETVIFPDDPDRCQT